MWLLKRHKILVNRARIDLEGREKKAGVHIISESLLDEGILAPTQQTVGSIRHISDIYLQTEEILINSRWNGKQHKQGIAAS